MSESPKRGSVVVYGPDIRRQPLLDSAEAQLVVIKDVFGDAMALFVRILSDDTWGLSTKGDPDWSDMLVKYGLAHVKPDVSAQDLISHGIAQNVV
jgi:hypothetical protein